MPAVGYQHLCQIMGLSSRGPSRPALIKPVSWIDPNDGFLAVPEAIAPSEADVLGHVLFALKHEGTDLQVLSEAFPKMPGQRLLQGRSTRLLQLPASRSGSSSSTRSWTEMAGCHAFCFTMRFAARGALRTD